MTSPQFISPQPQVTILSLHARPYETAVAAARTCYSSQGLVTADDVSAGSAAYRDRIALGIYQGGHHTTFQHPYVQFALKNVSRQFLWTFLHGHTFYNSEQVSQRYVEVRPEAFAVPPLEGKALDVYRGTIEGQIADYRALTERLIPPVRAAYQRRFPARQGDPRAQKTIRRKALEVARYVLPVATLAYLYHTVSLLTVLRYWRLCRMPGAPLEQRIVVEQMVSALLEADPLLETVLQAEAGQPLPPDVMPEWGSVGGARARAWAAEFDAALEGRASKLVSHKPDNQALLAQAVRGVLGQPRSALSDREAIELALSPARNPLLAGPLNLSSLSRLGRTLYHPGYTFYKKLSHSADSQNQRHRMTPASRPFSVNLLSPEPDYVIPGLVGQDPAARQGYVDSMERAWEGIERLAQLGVSAEVRAYLLPNAVSVRLVESSDLLNLRHKLAMRLCYNAQEEIWRASVDETEQVRAVNPDIGAYLLPPCGLRQLAELWPRCPEGERYCGVPVWHLGLDDYERRI